jgi:hypothetical protein
MHTAIFDRFNHGQIEINTPASRALEHIALEASVINNLKELVQGYLPSFTADLVQMVKNISDHEHTDYLKEFLSKDGRAVYKAKHLDYMTFGLNLTSVPEGFDGLLVPYGQSLLSNMEIVLNRIGSLVASINTYMSTIITNKDRQLSMNDLTKYYQSVAKERETMIEDLARYFSKEKTTVSKAQINHVLQRMGDIADIKELMVELDKKFRKFNLDDLQKRVQETIDLADLLKKSMASNDIPTVAPAVAKSISGGLYETARYIEFVVAFYYDVVVYMKSCNDLYDRILQA